MKRIIISSIFIVSALSAVAQDIYSATSISENNYAGTARSIALGNAMTAVGGDLGSFTINPAGSAVSSYNQITLTPDISVAFNASRYAPSFDISRGPSESDYGPLSKYKNTRFVLPNIGANFNFETGNNAGLVSFSFGILSNVTNNYQDGFVASGQNIETSMLGALASDATADVYNDFWSLNDEVASNSYMILKGSDVDPELGESQYFGATESPDAEGIWRTLGAKNPLLQISSVSTYGTKRDLVLNMGFNISNKVYLGVNFGMPRITTNYQERFSEGATDPEQYPIYCSDTYFKSSTYSYQLDRVVTGVYAKFGVIALPTDNLRLGLAVQTPVSYNVSEGYSVSGNLTTGAFSNNSSASDNWSYRLRAPYRINAGVAYTFANRAFVSLDYEMADYSIMRFNSVYDYNADYFYSNTLNKLFRGVQHMFRVGVEYRLTTALTARAGYNLSTTPERYYMYNGERVTSENYADFQYVALSSPKYYADKTMSFAAGLGYSTQGSLFFDLAARYTKYPTSTFMPYSDYIYDGNLLTVPSPTVSNSRSLLDIVLTIGCRF